MKKGTQTLRDSAKPGEKPRTMRATPSWRAVAAGLAGVGVLGWAVAMTVVATEYREEAEAWRAKAAQARQSGEVRVADIWRDALQAEADAALAQRRMADAAAETHDALTLSSASLSQQNAALADRVEAAERARDDLERALGRMAAALSETVAELDAVGDVAAELEAARAQDRARFDATLSRLGEAASAALEPLERTLAAAGFDVGGLLEQMRRERSRDGMGGPFIPADGAAATAEGRALDASRMAAVSAELDRLALLSTATQRMPFAVPVTNPRFTSGFGARRDPLNGRRSLHNGLDMAGPVGTPILSPGEGFVTYAGWRSGYGRVIEIDHGFGVRTMYAHLRRWRVEKGARVVRGDRLGDMGSSGRSTGSHLHYEIHVNGRPVNPKRFIEAARDVL